jgi:hypothetical protein
MANETPNTDTTIESLLEQRAQYEQWLSRLDAAADKASPAVRQRVRGDYESRLRGVIEQLRGHAATIAEELERHRTTQSELDNQRRQAEETLAEAEVRHTVGEYGEDEWREINDRSQGRLEELRRDLKGVGVEIARLEEVQALIASPRRPEPTRPSASAPPAPTPVEPEPVVVEAPPPPAPAGQRPAPKPPTPPRPREPEPTPQAAADELAFLKSVSDEERKPAARRTSNPGAASPAQATAPAQAPSGGKAAAPGVAKTLKCGECGTLNRPTEWYCERCGAELAGV